MSQYSFCFLEGQAGNCGLECKGLAEGECEIEDEIFATVSDKELWDYGYGDDYLFDKYIGEFRHGVLSAQSQFEYDKDEYLRKQIFGEE